MQTRLHYKVVLVYQMFPSLAMQFLFNHKKRLGQNKTKKVMTNNQYGFFIPLMISVQDFAFRG
ncbi:hypothetical protein AV649_19400 [Rossellomorea marisflavi]|uniref:Uncharacterized protein n=1 Tax=Rossellomorea marisflavi TaxID=189381 RepID=A0A161TDH3_9BACI|nr:hypothetical protein AV649_19400 [Rossellomorea marisflavi]